MKKIIFVLLSIIAFQSNAQMDNLTNLSVEWMRTGARNAATNGTDIAVYNPAGLTHLTEGVHLNFSNQSLFRSPSHSYNLGMGEGEKMHTQTGSDPFLPELFFAYNKNKFALYAATYMAGGGATMNYPDGSLTTDLIALGVLQAAGGGYMSTSKQSLKASSMYLTMMAGAAYSLSKNISASLSIRNISAKNTAEGGMTLTASPFDFPDQPLAIDYEENANGVGAVVGINANFDGFTISARYESKVKLDFKTKQNKDDFGITVDGQMNRRDLPAVAGIGMAYSLSSKTKAYVDMNYFFQTDADWGKSTLATNERPLSQLAGNAYGLGLGFEYAMNEKLTACMGGGYTKYMYEDKAGYYTHLGTYEVMQDNNANINSGFGYQATSKLKLNAAFMHTFWASDQNIKTLLAQPLDVDVKVNNSMNAIALGLEINF